MAGHARFHLALGAAGVLTLALSSPSAAMDNADDSLEALLGTTVTSASKYEQKESEVAAAVSVITRDDIKTFGWRTLAEAIASLPGLHVTYDRQYSYLGARGFGLPGDYNSRVLLAINGNRVNDVVFDGALIGREFPLDLDLVERIEFVAGPGGAIYGQNAMFGVINVITRRGAQVDGGELSAAWHSPQSGKEGRLSWGKQLDNGFDVLVSASGLHARGEDLTFDFPGAGPGGSTVSGVANQQDGERDEKFYLRLARGTWSFDLVHGDRRKDDPTASYLSDPLAAGQYQRDAFLLGQLQFQDSYAADTLNLLGNVFFGQYRYTARYHYSGAPNHSTTSSDWYGADLRALYTGVANHKLVVGVELQENTRVDQTNDDLTLSGLETQVLKTGYRAGVYVQDDWRVNASWSTTLGLRADRNNVTGTQYSPRAAVIWQVAPGTTMKALFGRAHRAPNSYERDFTQGTWLIANAALSGETIDTRELVVDQRMAQGLTVRGSLYQWTMRNIITLGIDPVSGVPQYQSGDEVSARGVEFSADQAWDSGGRLRGSVSYQDVRLAGGARPANSPHWLGKLNYARPLPWDGVTLGYELRYDAQRTAIDGSELRGYWLSNVTLVAGRVARGLDLSIGLYNLFNQRYQHPGADTNWQTRLDQDGRSVRAKLDYRF